MMNKKFIFISHMLLIIALLGCGGSKDELVIEGESAESLLQKGESAYANGNYDEALKLTDLMLTHFPTSDLHIDAQLLNARVLGAQEKYEDQFDLLLRILKENIIPEKVPQIYLQIGEFYENSARWNPGTISSDSVDYSKAADFYKKAVFYPNSDDRQTKSHALYRMALTNAKINNIEIASKSYQELISVYPESPYSTLARTKLTDPTNTDELPLPTTTASVTPATQGLESETTEQQVIEQPVETTQETITPVTETATGEPEKIQLPDDEAEEPSILDSLKTIDNDENAPEDE